MHSKRKFYVMEDETRYLNKFTNGVVFLMLGQLLTKGVTFMLNSLLIRFLSPRIFGITSFLEFLLSAVLFFSRESIRISTLRMKHATHEKESKNEKKENINDDDQVILQSLNNFGYIPIMIGLPLSIVLISWQYSNLNTYFIQLPYFRLSIFLIWFSILIELMTEPFYLVHQFLLNHEIRSKYESIGVSLACITNFVIVVWFEKMINGIGEELHNDYKQEGISILAFSMGKLVHSLSLLICYSHRYWKHDREKYSYSLTKIKLSTGTTSYYFQTNIIQYFKKAYFQLCFKHLLTEGDKLIINSLCTVEEQGIFSLLSNYGSLITRLLFAPIEESLRLFLTRLLSVMSDQNLRLSIEVLINLTKFYLYLALFIVVFGPVNSSFLLRFVIGSKWSSTSVLESIRSYCFYIPFLSLNGVFEAFFQSVATGDEIFKHSYLMMIFSGIFLFTCWFFIEYLNLSLDGLILSNILNMAMRITYCGFFINKFYHRLFSRPEQSKSFLFNFSVFKRVTLFASLLAGIDWYFIGYVKNFHQLAINVLLAVILFLFVIYNERELCIQLIRRSNLIS